jgi:HD-GYP domain-containing protein (c-di-GMP phosphodiesterase class II)
LDGLAGDAIPREARIVAVAAALEVLTARYADRADAVRAARDDIARSAGTQFDAEVVKTLMRIPIKQLEEVRRVPA